MFDARSILDILLRGPSTGPRQGRQADPSVFRDMLDQLGDQPSPPPGGQQSQPGQRTDTFPPPPQDPARSSGGMSLEDLLRTILTGGAPPPQQGGAPQEPGGAGQPPVPGGQQGPAATPEVGTELQDLLRQILQGARSPSDGGTRIPINRLGDGGGESGQGGPGGAQGGMESLGEILKQVLGQAVAGTREGAARIDEATGFSSHAREALGQATGRTPEDLVAYIRNLIAENQTTANAALGGLGALVLGTRAGRSLAGTALRLGSLALIGGLAYKAVQNYQQGRPILSPGQSGEKQTLMPAPAGSGFEPDALTDDAARLCIRAMIAAAAADGRIDGSEQQRIVGGLRQAGLDEAAKQFLAAEINNPATVAELASGVASPEEAVEVYTAARIAVDPDTNEEHAFLASLADALGIDDELASQVDAEARAAAA